MQLLSYKALGEIGQWVTLSSCSSFIYRHCVDSDVVKNLERDFDAEELVALIRYAASHLSDKVGEQGCGELTAYAAAMALARKGYNGKIDDLSCAQGNLIPVWVNDLISYGRIKGKDFTENHTSEPSRFGPPVKCEISWKTMINE